MNQSRAKKKNSDTELKILEVATDMFADRGFDGVSLREILDRANANIAAGHYYFGSKEGLYLAALTRFIPQIIRERIARLAKVQKTSGFCLDAVETILRGYAEPHFAIAKEPGGLSCLKLFSRYQSDATSLSMGLFRDEFGPARSKYVKALKAALAPIEENDLNRGFSFFVSSLLVSPADYGFLQLGGKPLSEVSSDQLCEQIVQYNLAGLKAMRNNLRSTST